MSHQLNVGIIGCGYWGKNYVRLFNEMLETNVSVVCDKNPQVERSICERYSNVAFTTEYDDVLNMPEVDAVVIATTATQHYDVAQACLQAGKHVLIEKPITSNSLDGDELVRLAAQNNVKLMVGHIYLFNSAIQQAKQYLGDPQLGKLHYIYTQRTNLGPIRDDVNVSWDLAPHDISILNYFMDSAPEWVNAVGQNLSSSHHVDVVFITLGYPNGTIGHIHVSWADPSKVRDIVIVGSQRRIYLNDMDPQEPIRIFERGLQPSAEQTELENRFTIRDGDIISPRVKLSEPLRAQCQHFVDCVVNDKPILTHGASGVDVVRVLEAIDESIASGGQRIVLNQLAEAVH